VQLGYNGRPTTSLVWDVGPWNEDDTYWLSPADAQYRRVFPNLPQGLPEAQAAYFNGYNGGRDQFGRIVGNGGGIDLGEGVRQALGLGYLENVWLDVTYLWTNDPEPWEHHCPNNAGCGCRSCSANRRPHSPGGELGGVARLVLRRQMQTIHHH
jgi:hypothetical protein